MSRRSPFVIELSVEDRDRLEKLVRQRTAEQRMVLRARIVLRAADGEENATIAQDLAIALNTVIKWRKRFFEEGADGLSDRGRSGRPKRFSPSGPSRGQGAGLRAAGHHRRSAVPMELLGAGPPDRRAPGGRDHLAGYGVANTGR